MNDDMHETRRRWPLLVAACAALFQAALCPAARAEGARLSAILEMARQTDAQFAAARAVAAAGREKLPQALAGLRPSASLSFSVKNNHDGSTAYEGQRFYEGGATTLTVSQPIFRPANMAVVEQAEIQVRLAELQLGLAEQDLQLRVVRAYFDVLQSAEDLAQAIAQREALVQQLAQAKRAFEVGTVPVTDYNEAQARHDLAQAQEIAARNDLALRKRTLERSLARPLPSLSRLKEGVSVELLGEQAQLDLVDQAPREALQVKAARASVEVAEIEIRRRDHGHEPTLDVVASASNNRNVNYGSFGGTDTRQTSIGFELNVPLYQGGAVSSRQREAVADRLRTDAEASLAERQALLDAQQAQLGVQSGVALIKALQQALSSSEAQLRSTQRGLQVGIRTRVDVFNAQQQVFATRKDLASARHRTLVSLMQLKASAGALRAADLNEIDALLE
jgi:outer membrane protein